MLPIPILPDQVEFLLLSFEGPDPYSLAGGLGVRIANLAAFLAAQGFRTHLLFIGDPALPGLEPRLEGRLLLYRWCQWISRSHPLGVYDGEEPKLQDFTASAPPFIVDHIARPAFLNNRHLVVLAEEWHTAPALIRLSDLLHAAALRPYSVLFWNANNTKGFDRIDFPRLNFVATLTTVSRYMKQIMRAYGLDPLVIPNGIPQALLQPPPPAAVCRVRQALASPQELLMLKVGRYDPDKCWRSAIEAAALLKHNAAPVRFLCRGGIEGYGAHVLAHARSLGLTVQDVDARPQTWEDALQAITAAPPADVYNLRFSLTPPMLHVFYAAADFVLANSRHEPFGLVGLEAMAAGGVVFTGPTGEAYSVDGAGAIALDTDQPSELVLTIQSLRDHPDRRQAIRQAAPAVASRYTWDKVVAILFEKILLASAHQEVTPFPSLLLDLPRPARRPEPHPVLQPAARLLTPAAVPAPV